MSPKNGQGDVQTKVRLPKQILKAIDDHRFDNRLSSRNQAILDLIERGVAAIQEAKDSNQPAGDASNADA